MRKQSGDWAYVQKPSRPPLTAAEVTYWKTILNRLLKAGVEVEYNLPEKSGGTCEKNNFTCPCVAVFPAKTPIPETKQCFEQCLSWTAGKEHGDCALAAEHGCAGIYCTAFRSPCSRCQHYDRGCAKCPKLYNPRRDPRALRTEIGKELSPTKFVGEHGPTGVYKVCKDGSLRGEGGVEVATVGKRVHFESLRQMISGIIQACRQRGADVDERCSVHIHLLASYLTPDFGEDRAAEFLRHEISEMEKALPEIVLANFHQLVRRYHCALIWLSAAGTSPEALTRWEKFRKPILQFSAVRSRMPQVIKEVAATAHKAKYTIINYQPCRFDDLGNVSRLHIEARHMDGTFSAAAIAAHACLLYALMVKAVEISHHGLLYSNHAYMTLQREILQNLCNKDGAWDGSRLSDTRNLGPYYQTLREQSQQLLRIVSNVFVSPDMGQAGAVLAALAEEPIALRLIRGQTWEQIEHDLLPPATESSLLAKAVLRLVDTAAISDCQTADEWITAVADELTPEASQSSAEAHAVLRQQILGVVAGASDSPFTWSAALGSFICR